MKGQAAETFLFLVDLAWKSKITMPVLISVVFMVLDFNMQVRFSIRGARNSIEDSESDNDEEFTTDSDDGETDTE